MNRVLQIVFAVTLICVSVFTTRARGQVVDPRRIFAIEGVSPSLPITKDALLPVGEVVSSREDSAVYSESWYWAAEEPETWAAIPNEPHFKFEYTSLRAVSVEEGAAGCGTADAPESYTDKCAVYNATVGEIPRLVGVRYRNEAADETWILSDDYSFEDALVVSCDEQAKAIEPAPEWSFLIQTRTVFEWSL